MLVYDYRRMTERTARIVLEHSQEDMDRWHRTARECDDAIIRIAGIKATMVPTAFHDMSRVAIGIDLARIMHARWRAHRDYDTGPRAFRVEARRMAKAVGWYLLACARIGSMDRVEEYVYSGRPQSRLNVAAAR